MKIVSLVRRCAFVFFFLLICCDMCKCANVMLSSSSDDKWRADELSKKTALGSKEILLSGSKATSLNMIMGFNNEEPASHDKKTSLAPTEDREIESEFFPSVRQANLGKVEELLRKKPDLVNLADGNGCTALNLAVIGARDHIDNSLELLRVLLNTEDVNVNNVCYSYSPLGNAFTSLLEENDAEKIIDILLNAKGIDLNAGESALIPAVIGGYTNAVKKLLDAGINVNAAGLKGCTAYHRAIRSKREDMVEILVNAKGINLDALCDKGRTGVHEAVYQSYNEEDDYSGIIKKLSTLEKVNMNARGKDGGTALHLSAALPGQIKMFEALLDTKKIDVNAIDNDGKTALFHVVKSPCKLEEKIEKIKKLVEAGINLGIADKYGDTALHEAISASDYNDDIVQVLLDAGANTRIANKDGKTTFEKAVENKRYNLVHTLKRSPRENFFQRLFRRAGLVKRPNSLVVKNLEEFYKDKRDFFYSLEQQDIEKVKELLKKEPDLVNSSYSNGLGGLCFVIAAGNADKKIELLETLVGTEGVDVNVIYGGYTPLGLAFMSGLEPSVVEKITDILLNTKGIDVNAGESALIPAVVGGYTNAVKKLLDAGINVNSVGVEGYTAYHYAILARRKDMIETLVNAKGINLDALCARGRTGIHEAVYMNYNTGEDYEEIIKKLSTLEKVNMNARDKDGNTALHFSASLERMGAFETLLDTKKIDVNAVNNDGKTVLHIVATSPNCSVEESVEKIEQLVDAGINVNIVDKNGNTALHEAICIEDYRYSDDIVRALLDAEDIDVNIPNKDGKTALDKAIENKRFNIINMLKRRKNNTVKSHVPERKKEDADKFRDEL